MKLIFKDLCVAIALNFSKLIGENKDRMYSQILLLFPQTMQCIMSRVFKIIN